MTRTRARRWATRNYAARCEISPSTFGERRKVAITTVDDWEGLRERARAIKDETLAHLDQYLEAFADKAERAGAQIHWAHDAGEACAIVLSLLRERNATRVVKSKSMATEEIHLNTALEAEGLTPVETDLGEWIIQLAKETPSHIVVPAIHKSKNQIAELFVEKLGIEPTDDVAVLTGAARRVLRQRFAEAQVGISGVNFGVAETGTILILENEGNVRLTTSLPKTHIALMGIEKVIPRFSRPRRVSQTAATVRNGPTFDCLSIADHRDQKNPEDEGPEEVHIVLMDNGRSRMLESSGHAPVARLHPLRRVSERLSGLSADRRTCLWFRLSRSNRCSDHAATDRPW